MSSSTSLALTVAAMLCGCALTSTNSAWATQAAIDSATQTFVFNPPRTYGLRMRVNF